MDDGYSFSSSQLTCYSLDLVNNDDSVLRSWRHICPWGAISSGTETWSELREEGLCLKLKLKPLSASESPFPSGSATPSFFRTQKPSLVLPLALLSSPLCAGENCLLSYNFLTSVTWYLCTASLSISELSIVPWSTDFYCRCHWSTAARTINYPPLWWQIQLLWPEFNSLFRSV